MIDKERKERETRLEALSTLESCHGVVQHPRHELPIPFFVTPISLPSLTCKEKEQIMIPFWNAHPPVPWVDDVPPPPPAISDEAKRLLMLIVNKPGQYSTRYYTELGWSLGTGTRIRNKLEDGGYLKCHRIRTGLRGGAPEIIELLLPAYKLLGLPKPSGTGHGSFEHGWWMLKIAQYLGRDSQGEVVREKYLNGKSVDIGARSQDGWIAYEVQLPSSVRNDLLKDLISKDLQAGFVKIVICVLTAKEDAYVAAVITEMNTSTGGGNTTGEIRARVGVRLLGDFLQGENK